jgi:enoyl-CoA hydratase/carnithine racemase
MPPEAKESTMSQFDPTPSAAFTFREILYTKSDWVATLTINRPESYNAYTTRTLQEMTTALKDAAWDDGVAVLVLTGAGKKAFCTGGDVKEYQREFLRRPRDYWKWMGLFQETLDLLRNLGKPTIARLNGMVAGGGNELNLACDLAVAAEDVTIRQVGTRVGSVACGGATQWLPITIGDRRAREMLFTCDPIDARTALDWGLLNRVVPAAELDLAVAELCAKMIDKFPEAMRYTKQQVNFWKDFAWYQTIGHARDWLALHYTSMEPWEGMNAFVEKRQPDHRGIRGRAAGSGSSEFVWGPYVKECGRCHAKGIPEGFAFCGRCGASLSQDGELPAKAKVRVKQQRP